VPLKNSLRELLDQGRFDRVAELAVGKRRVLGSLISLTFDADPQIGWRAVEAMGAAASRIAEHDPDYVREHVRRLLWLVTEESGAICWRAPEAMAETVCALPSLLGDYTPIVVHLLVEFAEEDLDHFRVGVLWAIGRLGTLARDHIRDVLPAITSALDHPDPQVRGMAVWCLGRVAQVEALASRPALLCDEGEVDLYEDGVIDRTSVARLAAKALGVLPRPAR
jgi:hypothetical protein